MTEPHRLDDMCREAYERGAIVLVGPSGPSLAPDIRRHPVPREHVRDMLALVGGDVRAAALACGVSTRTVQLARRSAP